jgi:hypothetical protein
MAAFRYLAQAHGDDLMGGHAGISLSSNLIVPVFGFIRPLMVRSVVDLPAPLEPIRVTISPSLTSMLMPLMA